MTLPGSWWGAVRRHPRLTLLAAGLSLAAACPESGPTDGSNTPPTVAAPSVLLATPVSATQINLTWTDNSTNEDGFRVERAPGGTATFTEIGSLPAGGTAFQNTGLSGATAYVYRVRAFSGSTMSEYSATATATTAVALPAAPSGLTASTASATQLNLSWTDNSNNEDGFRIERSSTGTTGFSEIATVAAGVTSYPNTGLTPSSGYTYRVRAYNTAGTSAYSNNAAGFTPAASGTPPSAPSALVATAVSGSQINLTWADNSSDEDGFKIERAPGSTSAFVEIGTAVAGATSYPSTGLSSSSQYSYRVRAYNGAGNSGYSGVATANTQSVLALPAAPSNLQTVPISPSEIDLTWNDNSSNEDQFIIERAPDGVTFTEIGSTGANTVIYWDQTMSAATTATYRIRAYNGAGYSAYSNEAAGTTPPNPPSPPSSLVGTAVSSTEIDLTWFDQSLDETGFRIERAPGGTSSWATLALLGPGVSSYPNTGLTAGASYSYRVQAYNAGGYSASSNEITVSTLATAPTPPSNLTATASTSVSSVIHLTWTDNASNENGFLIEQAVGGGGFAQIGAAAANLTALDITGLTGAVTYSYRIRAYNGNGNSLYSNSASATTLPSQIVVYASAANAMEVEFVNGVQDAVYSNNVYQNGKIAVGCNVVVGATSVAACIESALQFNGFAAAVSGRTITSAVLRMYPSDLPGDLNAVYGAFLFTSTWSPASITYNTEPGIYNPPQALQAPPNSGAPVDFNVTSHVQAWAGGTANNGFLVTPTSTAPGSVVETTFFWSDDTYNANPALRPQLILNLP